VVFPGMPATEGPRVRGSPATATMISRAARAAEDP
jgi:hypothetical protein